MKKEISLRLLRSRVVTPRNKPFEITDARLPGFILRIQPSGRMSYIVRWRGGRRMTLGAVGILTPAEARQRAERVLGNVAHDRSPDDGLSMSCQSTNLGAFVEGRFADWAQANYSDPRAAMERLRRCFGHWFDRSMPEITVALIDHWVSERLRAGKAGSTINRDLSALSAVLSKAVTWQQLPANPVRLVTKCRIDKIPVTRFLTSKELSRLRKALRLRDMKKRKGRLNANRWRRERGYPLLPPTGRYSDHLTPLVLLSLNSGCRRGELLSLTWKDVDFSRRLLTVSGPRTKNGQTRVINLNTEAMVVLERWRRQSKSLRLFCSADGKRLSYLKTAWARVLRDAGIKDFRWHDLRHTFASNLVMKGVDLNTVRELLGHSDISMTLRYAHLSSEHKAEAVQRLCA